MALCLGVLDKHVARQVIVHVTALVAAVDITYSTLFGGAVLCYVFCGDAGSLECLSITWLRLLVVERIWSCLSAWNHWLGMGVWLVGRLSDTL